MNASRVRQRGLTLVELLIVITILALASSVVLLNAPPARPEVREDAERFAARLQLAMDEAIATGAALRVTIDAEGYAFERRTGGEWKEFADDRALGRMTFDKRSVARVELADAAGDNARALGDDERGEDEGGDEEDKREIALDPLGVQTGFTLRLTSREGVFVVKVDEAGAISVKKDA